MASTDDSSSGGSSGGGSGAVEFLTSPIGMALAGGFALALVAGYLII